jgi:hypothetical protein
MEVTEHSAESPPPRVYERDWRARHWRGSLDEIVSAAQAARDEVSQQEPDLELWETLSVDFSDESTQRFDSLAAFERNLGQIEPQEVANLRMTFASRLLGERASCSISCGGLGLTVSGKGSMDFANEIVGTLKSRLAGGAEAGERNKRLPWRPVDWFICAAGVIVTLSVALGVALVVDDDQLSSSAGVLAAYFPGFGAWWLFSRSRRKLKHPRAFELVAEGQQFPANEGHEVGPIWTTKRWFEAHPAISVVTLLVGGALLGRAAELIQF